MLAKPPKKTSTNITEREKEIIRLIEQNCTNKQIATVLKISIRTVETHRKNIYQKTNTHNVLALVKWCYTNMLLLQ